MGVAKSFIEAFNERDVDTMLTCFTPDATYHDLLYGLHYNADGQFRPMFERFFREGEMVWTADHIVEAPNVELVEWSFTLTQTEAAPRGRSEPVEFRGASVFELSGGACSAYREHFDKGTVLARLGLQPESLHRILTR